MGKVFRQASENLARSSITMTKRFQTTHTKNNLTLTHRSSFSEAFRYILFDAEAYRDQGGMGDAVTGFNDLDSICEYAKDLVGNMNTVHVFDTKEGIVIEIESKSAYLLRIKEKMERENTGGKKFMWVIKKDERIN